MQNALQRYWTYLKIERQVSPHTLSNYQRQLVRVVEILQHAGIQQWQQVTPSVVRFVIAQSHKDGLHEKSLALRLSALRRFLSLFGATWRTESQSGHRYFRAETGQAFTEKY